MDDLRHSVFAVARRLSRILLIASWGLCPVAFAALPETGMYWSDLESGKGYYVELQGETVFVTAYAYQADDGEPVFYVGSANLTYDSPGPPDYEFLQPVGMYPVHKASIELYEVRGGVCLACEGIGHDPPEKKGRITLWFVWPGEATIEMRLDDGTHHQPFEIRRYVFGVPALADANLFSRRATLIGEWVFTDVSNPTSVPRRFRFTERVDNPLQQGVVVDFEFRDVERQATFRCFNSSAKVPGCELSQSGEILMSVNYSDVGINQLQGYVGELVPRTGLLGRRPETVIGVRIGR